MLGGRWCDIVLNVRAPSEDKSGHAKDSLCEELEQVFYHFPKYHLEILLGFFNTKVGRQNIFKLTIKNESLHEDSNDNGVSKLCYIRKSGCEEHNVSALKHS